MDTFNVLVLGQTGVGKSTFINAFANYLTFNTFEEALAVEPVCLIPTHFSLLTDDYEEIVIKIGENENERSDRARSFTRDPQVYKFCGPHQIINVIDVPGVGDTEGLEHDDENAKKILNMVTLFKELHGIFIVLKAGDSKLTAEYKYCLSELLMHLHRSSLNNIFFIFTNSRGYDYKTGNAHEPLRAYLQELNASKGIMVSMNKETVYCIDNDGYRFQCAYFQHAQFRGENHDNYRESWMKSRDSVVRMFGRMKKIQPHKVADTLSINEARSVVVMLLEPLATITNLIQTKFTNITDNFDGVVNDLQANLTISDFDIELEELSRPRTVCTSKKCIGVERLRGTGQYVTYFKQICHETCYLTGVSLKQFPEPRLLDCAAMQGHQDCQRCGCSHLEHMHIDVNQRKVMKPSRINTKFANLAAIDRQTAENGLQNVLDDLRREQEVITKTVVDFGRFLKSKSILEYNNDFEERLKLEIRKEDAVAARTGSDAIVRRLRSTLEDFQRQKQAFDVVLGSSDNADEIDVGKVVELRDALFALPLHGEKIHELYSKHALANRKNYSEKNFVVHNVGLTL